MNLYFSPQSEKYLNSKGSEKIKKLANKLIIFTNSNNVMMVSIVVKEVSWTSSHLESFILNYEMYSIFVGTRTNRGNRCRKIYLCIKGCLRASFCKYRESGDSFKIFNFFIFCPNKAFSELFSKIQLKDPKALEFFQNRGKFENRHFGLPPPLKIDKNDAFSFRSCW